MENMLEINKVYNGDCLEVMREIDDKSVDMILCDLPYGTTKCKWDQIIPFDKLWKEYKRIIKDDSPIVLCATQPFTSYLITSNIDMYKYTWVWDKVRPLGHLVSKKRPMQRTEEVVVFGNKKTRYFPQTISRNVVKKSKEYSRTSIMGGTVNADKNIERELTFRYPVNVLVFSNASQVGKLHPTQKPVALFEYLIRTYTTENMLVLDNCAGSGTTGVACKNTNRNFILIEKEKKYCDIIEKRLAEILL